MVKNPQANAGDVREAGSISVLGRSPGGGYVNPLWYSCLVNSMGREAWQAAVHRVTKNQTQLKQFSTHVLPLNLRSQNFPGGPVARTLHS